MQAYKLLGPTFFVDEERPPSWPGNLHAACWLLW